MKVRFINFERKKLPEEILKLNGEEKMKYIPNYNPEDDKIDAQIQVKLVFIISLISFLVFMHYFF